jgi:hypothetical protein
LSQDFLYFALGNISYLQHIILSFLFIFISIIFRIRERRTAFPLQPQLKPDEEQELPDEE